jgi:hypothetical protein
MSEFLAIVAVTAVSACVLGVAFFALYQLNKAVGRSGR